MATTKKKVDIIDLTTKKGKIGKVSASASSIKDAPFLHETKVNGSSKACYFSDQSVAIPNGDYFFEMGLIKLPIGIQYVKDKTNWKPEATKTTQPIYGNVLLGIQTNQQQTKAFHLCDNLPADGLQARTYQGCAGLLRSIAPSTAIKSTVLQNSAITLGDTPVLYFKGELYFSDDYSENCGYFLIPMSLSEKLVVYFVVKEDTEEGKYRHKEILAATYDMLQKDPTLGENIGIIERLQLNDKLGIFVTRKIGAGHEVLKNFPYTYDLVSLEKTPE